MMSCVDKNKTIKHEKQSLAQLSLKLTYIIKHLERAPVFIHKPTIDCTDVSYTVSQLSLQPMMPEPEDSDSWMKGGAGRPLSVSYTAHCFRPHGVWRQA